MMTIEDIKNLIANGEDRQLELKKTTGELKDGMHTACAFLNTDGGWLIFGIAPTSLKILGQQVTDRTQQEIAQSLSGLEPAVNVMVEYIDIPERSGFQLVAIYFETFVWGRQPYTFHGCPYYKVESTTKVMPREMFEERLRANKPQYYAWERQKAERVSISDLNEERVRGTIRLGVERGRMMPSAITERFENVLDKLQLLNNGTPNNAAATLFGTNIYEYPQFRLRMARFRGTDKNEFVDNQRAEGNFFDLLDAGMSFFFKHLSISGKITGFVREEHLEIPAEALREILINALCHRQYEKYNLTIGIAIYDDRIEIENPGVLPPQLTPETIKQPHISYPYNPIIADVLFKTTFLENWGSGTKRVIDACKQQNVPEPEWKTQDGFVIVTFNRVTEKLSAPQVGLENDPSTTLVRPKYDPSTTQVAVLIKAMNCDFMAISDMMKVSDLKSRKRFRENYVTPALKDGAIERKYPDQPNHPGQQYRLTKKAQKWREKNT
ncbi:MAG: ATP-dependent DNA helicase RecG [Bacteroidales bacterium]|nr:ATP-dependent DNA helicase RecG [Bacteroidales bacterium]